MGDIVRIAGPHNDQAHRLGFEYPDNDGSWWVYCEATVDFEPGDIVEDVDEITGQVTTVSPVGGRLLIDSGLFAGKDYRGAIFRTFGDTVGNGAGQHGFIALNDDENQVVVTVQAGWDVANAKNILQTGGGWIVATTTDTDFDLRQLGVVRKSTAFIRNAVRGVAQHRVDFSVNKFFWAKRTGVGFVALDASSADVPIANEPLLAEAGGLVTGLDASSSAGLSRSNVIGISFFGDVDPMEDILVRAALDIPSRGMGYRVPIDQIESLLHNVT